MRLQKQIKQWYRGFIVCRVLFCCSVLFPIIAYYSIFPPEAKNKLFDLCRTPRTIQVARTNVSFDEVISQPEDAENIILYTINTMENVSSNVFLCAVRSVTARPVSSRRRSSSKCTHHSFQRATQKRSAITSSEHSIGCATPLYSYSTTPTLQLQSLCCKHSITNRTAHYTTVTYYCLFYSSKSA